MGPEPVLRDPLCSFQKLRGQLELKTRRGSGLESEPDSNTTFQVRHTHVLLLLHSTLVRGRRPIQANLGALPVAVDRLVDWVE